MFTIDFTSRVPIYEQICNNVIRLASAGVFKSGDRPLQRHTARLKLTATFTQLSAEEHL